MKQAPRLKPIVLDKTPRTSIIERIKKESPKQGVFVIEMDKDIAHDFLFINDEYNRRREEDDIVHYSEEMDAGDWPYVGDTIKFAYDPKIGPSSIRMIDGQGRCESTLRTKTTHKFIIATGLPPEAVHYLDIQRRRRMRDSLHFMRYPNPDFLASAVMLCIMFKEKNRFISSYKYDRPNHHHAVYWCKKPSNHVNDLSRFITTASSKLATKKDKREHFFSIGQWGFIMYQLRYATNEELMMQFCTRLATGEGTDGRHILIHELRKLLRAIVKKEGKDYVKSYSRGIFTIKLHWTIRVFNLWAAGKTSFGNKRLTEKELNDPHFEKIFKL